MQQDPTDITSREASATDTADVDNVFNEAFKPLRSIYRPTGDAIAHQAERAKEGTRLVAEVKGRIVGTVQFVVHKRHVHVIGLAVRPDFQRMGVARRMIEWIVDQTPSLGHNVVALDTIKETGNVPLFERIGFRVVHEQVATWCVSDDYAEVHDVKMERDVAERLRL